jgi:hypothetical protein
MVMIGHLRKNRYVDIRSPNGDMFCEAKSGLLASCRVLVNLQSQYACYRDVDLIS